MVRLMDCTLRDGANVVGKGFDAEITKIVLDILTESNVPIIEFGNAGGIGAYEVAGFTNALTDMEYLDLVQPYLGKSEIGMFLNAKRFREPNVELAASKGMKFLRCGADAGGCEKNLRNSGKNDQKMRNESVLFRNESISSHAGRTGGGSEVPGVHRT